MYINITTRETLDLPALRRACPHISFPAAGPDAATLAGLGYAEVAASEPPAITETQAVTEGAPECVGGVWRQTWVVSEMTAEAYAVQVEAARRAAVSRLQVAKWAKMLGQYRDSQGHHYDVDADSRALLTGKVTTINAGKPLPEGFVWKTAEVDAEGQPVYVPHTDASLKALAFEVDDWTQAIFTAAETAQKAVRDAASVAAVAAAETAVVWPS